MRYQIVVGDEIQKRVTSFMTEMGITNTSAALRTLILTGLDKTDQIPAAIRSAAYREGLSAGISEIKKQLGTAVSHALDGLDG